MSEESTPTIEELQDLRERVLSRVHTATVASEAAAAASKLGTIERAITKITGEEPLGASDPLRRAASDDAAHREGCPQGVAHEGRRHG